MVEQDLEIVENGQYKNINLKPKLNKGIKGIDSGNHIVIEKIYAEGREMEGQYGKYYIVSAKYKDEEVGFFLNEKEHNMFKEVGGEGDKITISLNKEPYVNKMTGVEMLFNRLSFKLVE